MRKSFRYDDVPVLETTSGKLKGCFYDGTYIFKGVPYAYADRFQMPVPSEWTGVKDATSYGYVCPLMTQDKPTAELLVPHRYWPMDEHCQNLNIWTTALDREAKKPVIVWFHGGGYAAGSSIEQVAYDGRNMCVEGDAVVVSVNHRLNILGYLDLSPFGQKYENSGNAGHADMVAALQWIHNNIALFGGNPENVTIFGQSGGGMKVADLMQIPAADGLFHKELIMSGVSDASMMPSCQGNGEKIKGEAVFTDFFRHQLSAHFKEVIVVRNTHFLKSVRNTVLFQIFTKFNLVNNASINRFLGLTLLKNLFHIDTGGIVLDFNIDFLLEKHIICNLVIHRLWNAIFREIVLGKKMVNISSVFQHGLHIDLRRQKSSVMAFYLCHKEYAEVRAACDRSIQALYYTCHGY